LQKLYNLLSKLKLSSIYIKDQIKGDQIWQKLAEQI